MQLFLILFLTICGFVLIVLGGDLFVGSAIQMAERAKIPKVLIGATIVSIGTTLPEITISLIAAGRGDAGLAVSNATGSMLCNLTLVLGVGLTAMSMKAGRRSFAEKFLFAAANITLLLLFSIDLKISLTECIVLLGVFALFMTVNVFRAVHDSREGRNLAAGLPKPAAETDATAAEKPRNIAAILVLFVLGAAAIGVGAKLLVDNISQLATDYLHIPTVIVGATVVAFGTGLPEFVTAIGSIRKKSIDMSVGNILGANIINGTFLVGMSGALQGTAGLPVVGDTGSLAVFVCFFALLAGLLVLIPPMMIRGRTFRWQGWALLGIYAAYILYVILSAVL